MPAIQPVLLKKQIDNLFQHYDSPTTFIIILKELLDYYTDRTRRTGQQSLQSSQVRSYNIPKQILRQIEMNLEKCVESQPDTGSCLADLLWRESWLECRTLAFMILGWLPADQSDQITDRLRNWCQECGLDRVLDASLARGTTLLWKGSSELLMNLLESWLTSSDLVSRKWGLRVVNDLVMEPSFNNLPFIFRYLSPFVQTVSAAPDTDLLLVIRQLARRTPQETAYFLKRSLAISENAGIYALMRQSLDMFASPTQQDLQNFLHQMREQFGEH